MPQGKRYGCHFFITTVVQEALKKVGLLFWRRIVNRQSGEDCVQDCSAGPEIGSEIPERAMLMRLDGYGGACPQN